MYDTCTQINTAIVIDLCVDCNQCFMYFYLSTAGYVPCPPFPTTGHACRSRQCTEHQGPGEHIPRGRQR